MEKQVKPWMNAISIHTPRKGSDNGMNGETLVESHFYPHSSQGERR